ncbi:unnamed protein product [Protopolystoma xenopodis]|uniref:General transcription factor IIH subunit 4 n=1 Tax=Protopolystoma xenopodis TaxID=117903 RepID=A0A448WIJ0_9PLAT|nr:unnamed protein product [Protopolystoma xenopodis]
MQFLHNFGRACFVPSISQMSSYVRSSLFEYIKSLDIFILDGLYGHPPTCLVIFRELPELAKHLVLRLLFIEQAIPKSIVSSWVSKEAQQSFTDSCKALTDLRIWHSVDSNVTRGSWRLNEKFQEFMKISLFGGGKAILSDMESHSIDKHSKDKEFLTIYAAERWDNILHFMVGSDSVEIGTIVRDVMSLSGLMRFSDTDIGITQQGFHFLLLDRSSQVLRLILHYFDYVRENKLNLIEAIQLVFQLSFLSTDRPCNYS